MTTPENFQRAIGWIGSGKMGNPMATRPIEAGHALTICDPAIVRMLIEAVPVTVMAPMPER